jgi:hypothetical protein
MDLKAFRRDVQRKLLELEAAHPSGYVYLTSLDNRERNLVAGTTTEVNLQNAAVALCWRSHEISSAEQIAEYRQRCEEARQQIVAAGKRHINKELRISVDR